VAHDSLACPARRRLAWLGGLAATIRPLAAILPTSRALATLTVVGFATEALLIAWGRPNLYATDAPSIRFGLLFLGWFWLSTGWVLELAGRRWQRWLQQSGGAVRALLWLGLGLVAAVLTCGYAISWGLFFRSGRFANLETGRFLLFNFRHLCAYLLAAEPFHLLLAGLVTAAALLGLPGLLYVSVGRAEPRQQRPAGWSLVAWVGLALATLASWNHLPRERSTLRQAARQHALTNGLHPSFSLYVSHLESRHTAPIEPTLDVTQLRPLAAAVSYQPALATDGPPPSVIFVAVESLRHDVIHRQHQGREILPQINRLAGAGLQLTRAYAESTHSDYADVCLVSSLHPLRTRRHHYYGPSDPWPVTRIYDVLQPLGYATAIVSSQNEAWGGMDHFLASDRLDWFYHPETAHERTWIAHMDRGFSTEVEAGGLVAGKFPDAHTTGRAIEWIGQQVRAGKPFFLSMNFQSSHFPYLMPPEVPRPFTPYELSPEISFVDYPPEQVETVRNAYYNAIHECDHQIGRLVAALEALGQLDNTILVVTGENGEAFHECQHITHASDPVEPVIHVACVIHAPRYLAARVENYPFEHVDLVPTVLGLIGLPPHPNFQGIDILAPDRPPVAERLTFCHVLSSLAEADAIISGGQWKLTVDRHSGQSTLFDVVNDPLQTRDLLAEQPAAASRLRACLERWRQQQLAYYHFPAYYLNYFPPAPPKLSGDVR
jgi:arylsulfatase A-like enzyme